MLIYRIVLAGDIHWKISKNDPIQQDLLSLPGWFFINPLLYSNLPFSPQSAIWLRLLGIAKDKVIVTSNVLVLGTDQQTIDLSSIPFNVDSLDIIDVDSDQASDSTFMIISTYVERLATGLRQASRQVDIPRSFHLIESAECEALPKFDFPQKPPEVQRILLNKYIWDSAASWKHLVIADTTIADETVPVYEKLLLDAIHAFKNRDYRRALLYAAISIEALAATKLDEAYEDAKQMRKTPNNLRFISLTQTGGVLVKKDPVYEFLFGKSNFKERLHEVPLFILGRSILTDNEPLYQKAIKLYRTRNKIAHLGEAPSGETYFKMNEDDCIVAIDCALQIFKWFGVPADFPLPKPGFIELQRQTEIEIP